MYGVCRSINVTSESCISWAGNDDIRHNEMSASIHGVNTEIQGTDPRKVNA